MKAKKIYLLIGPKGSGKTHIGTLMQTHFSIPFVRVEDWIKDFPRDQGKYRSEYLETVFQTIENGIRNELGTTNVLVFESTGLSTQFDRMLANFQQEFKVTIIRVSADHKICLERIRNRDPLIHIPVSESEIVEINRLVDRKNIPYDFRINNDHASRLELIDDLEKILAGSS